MKKVSQKQLTDHIKLVKWQEKKKLEKLNLLTIHSLLLNSNPKFIELKQIIEKYNSNIDKGVQRKHLQCQYTLKLYQMLRHMILIPNYQNQQNFLNKVYQWSRQGGRDQFQFDFNQINNDKVRPTTASTRSRALSAYSRPKSGVTKVQTRKYVQQIQIPNENKNNIKIDYQKLQPGDIQFYNGIRTLYPNQINPKKKLKQYQRKIFYDQQADSDLEIVDLDKNKKQLTFYKHPIIQIQPQIQPLIDLGQNLQGQENLPAQQGLPLQGQQDLNADQNQIQGLIQDQEPSQVVDKLRPKRKRYIQHGTQLSKNKISYACGIHQVYQDRTKLTRKKMEDQIMKQKIQQWALSKSRIKRQQRRRAQSARIVTKKIGIKYNQPKKLQQNVNLINFQNVPAFQTKLTRPKTAFKSFNPSNRQQVIKNCFITSKMSDHIIKPQEKQPPKSQQRFVKISSVAERPKKKTFEQIIRQAQQKMKQEQMLEIQHVKQKFSKNKVPFETNRIAKSVTYYGIHQEQEQVYQDQYIQQITGINMLKNPFFKAGKKKKKKKKKK